MRPYQLDPLFAGVGALPGIGPKTVPLYDRLLGDAGHGARLIDLLFHLPTGAIDRRLAPTINQSEIGQPLVVKARVARHQPPPPGRRRAPFRVIVEDGTGDIQLVFFNAPPGRIESLLPLNSERYIAGTIELYDGYRQMTHPDRVMDAEAYARLPRFEPVYGLTHGLYSSGVQRAVNEALKRLPDLPEWQDAAYLKKQDWPDFRAAITQLHRPDSLMILGLDSKARQRLAYDELLAGQLALLIVRQSMTKAKGIARIGDGRIEAAILKALPYSLTQAQRDALSDIKRDLAASDRMLRLVQGDVGSGKTIVGLLAMAAVVEAGHQAALMAPTEILARQHYERLKPLCDAAGLNIVLLTGREKGSARQTALHGLVSDVDIAVGTHALFQDEVAFRDLGLAVIDEQHRFGVHQRLALGRKGDAVDMLVMTATPIPRTLVLTYFGDMEVSSLREKPAGRQPIDTRALSLERLDEVIEGARRAIANGQRIYWVCPLVEENEELDLAAAEERYADLEKYFGEKVGLVHGKMKGKDKDAAMAAFARGETQILVATTVIEVGVDVPEATIIIIEHAERFGLAQLHQLRGRVGRGSGRSTCLLLYKNPLGEVATARINTMRETEDGFLIAEQDLKLRGEGDVLGTRQSGMPGFRLAIPEKHGELLAAARDDAKLILARDPKLETERGQALRFLLYLFERDAAMRLMRAG
ncbi:MAG: ATP-dependent DNA helicase RecG [Beijerinckiaceae bacterium]|nr:ATP-dependent DNA helicase RecG [Beijerinckiaceae bacterium]